MHALNKKYFIFPLLFLLLSCDQVKIKKKYEIKIDPDCSFYISLPEGTTQKTYTIKGDSTIPGDVINTFRLDNDSSELKVISNTIASWNPEIKNYEDLKESLIGYKMGEFIFSEVVGSEFIKIDTLQFLKINYGMLLVGSETIYSTMQNGKIINFEFISHKYENAYFARYADEIMKTVSFSCK